MLPIETIMASQDIMMNVHATAYHGGEILANGISGTAKGSAWSFSWRPTPALQEWSRKGAFLLGVIWLIYVLAQFVIPSKRRGGGNVGIFKIIIVVAVILVMCDLTLIPKVINFVGQVTYMIGQMLGFV